MMSCIVQKRTFLWWCVFVDTYMYTVCPRMNNITVGLFKKKNQMKLNCEMNMNNGRRLWVSQYFDFFVLTVWNNSWSHRITCRAIDVTGVTCETGNASILWSTCFHFWLRRGSCSFQCCLLSWWFLNLARCWCAGLVFFRFFFSIG